MKIIYHCEICGKSSMHRVEIERCEAQGRMGAFEKNAEVEVQRKPGEWGRGRITSVHFQRGTHEFHYCIQAEPSATLNAGRLRAFKHHDVRALS